MLCRLLVLPLAVVLLVLGLLGPRPLLATVRPLAPQLLPKQTLAYLRIRDAKQLAERFNETALGRMSQEEKIRPLIAQLYGSAAEAFTQVEDEVGVPLEDILKLPQGEIVVSLVAPPEGRPALVTLIDVGPHRDTAEKLLKTGQKALADQGATKSTEDYRGVELIIHDVQNNPQPLVHFFQDETVVVTSDVGLAKSLLDVWIGDDNTKEAKRGEDATPAFEPLAANPRFTAVMKRCGGPKDDPAQLTWFVDPIGLVRAGSRGNTGAQVGLALLPALGLDGLAGVGGSVTFAAGDFDMVTHLHILLEEPRTGVIEALALEGGDATPEPWVPSDVASYTTVHWDVDKTLESVRSLYDSFRGEGRLSADIAARISDEIGIDFEREVIGAMGGRFTYITWLERPARIGSEAALVGFKLEEPKEFEVTLERIEERFGERLEKDTFGRVTYWTIKRGELAEVPAEDDPEVTDRQRRRAQRRRRRQETFRQLRPSPCFALVGDYLIVADRTSFLKKVIATKGDASDSLAEQLDFKLIASKIRRQTGGTKPGMITFSRPEESIKVLYEMATGGETRKQLSQRAENNGFFKALNSALEDNPLPPFPVLAQYLAPGGGMLTSDETGFHYTGFVLKRK